MTDGICNNASVVVNSLLPTLPVDPPHLANADTGTTGHYMSFSDTPSLLNICPAQQPVVVTLPDGSAVHSTHTAELDLPSLPPAARQVHLFPTLTGSLLSIGVLCDCGLTATYRASIVTITDDSGAILLTGHRSSTTRLWMVNLDKTAPPPHSPKSPPAAVTHSAAAMMLATRTHAQVVAWYHAALGSPSVSTMIVAIEKAFVSFPGLTSSMVRKCAPTPIATAKGHLDQTRAGLRSTRREEPTAAFDSTADEPAPVLVDDLPGTRLLRKCKVQTRVRADTRRRDSDMAGRFFVPSKRGNQYQLVMFCADENYIHVEPLRCRESFDYAAAYAKGDAFFRSRGVIASFERLDNETNKQLENFCRSKGISIQYLPPGNHRANKAERAIRTWKNHFIATLSTCDPTFPVHAWDELLEHAELTLNIVRASGRNPLISAWQQVNGPFDYDRTPLAPPGMRVLSHVKPDERASWDPHGIECFYVGPALQHYRCFRVISKETLASRVTDTLSWHPPDALHLPGANPYDDVVSLLVQLVPSVKRLAVHPLTLAAHRLPLQAAIPHLAVALQSFTDIFAPPTAAPIQAPAPMPMLPRLDPPVLEPPLPDPPMVEPLLSAPLESVLPVATTSPRLVPPPPGLEFLPAPVPAVDQSVWPVVPPSASAQRVSDLTAPTARRSTTPSAPAAPTRPHSDRLKRVPGWLRANAALEKKQRTKQGKSGYEF